MFCDTELKQPVSVPNTVCVFHVCGLVSVKTSDSSSYFYLSSINPSSYHRHETLLSFTSPIPLSFHEFTFYRHHVFVFHVHPVFVLSCFTFIPDFSDHHRSLFLSPCCFSYGPFLSHFLHCLSLLGQ